MPKTSKRTNPFEGRWRITWMDQWDQEFVDEEVEGYFEFEPRGMASFQFGYVRGQIDHRPSTRDGKPCIEFTWDGNDEMDPAMGRGWVVVDDDELNGMIVFHQGDESAFKCRRKAVVKSGNYRIRNSCADAVVSSTHPGPSPVRHRPLSPRDLWQAGRSQRVVEVAAA